MKYDSKKYKFDKQNITHEAAILDGAIGYRLTSHKYSCADQILNGEGPVCKKIEGRYNTVDQHTSYLSNNIFVCLAEVLHCMYKKFLVDLADCLPTEDINKTINCKKILVIFEFKKNINDIIFIDCQSIQRDYSRYLTGALLVHPEIPCSIFSDFTKELRKTKKGVFYPSARHSKDICIALFGNNTENINSESIFKTPIELKLISEDFQQKNNPEKFNFLQEKNHTTLGYYRFLKPAILNRYKEMNLIYPKDIPPKGIIDFVRRPYQDYPNRAFIPLSQKASM